MAEQKPIGKLTMVEAHREAMGLGAGSMANVIVIARERMVRTSRRRS